MLFSRRQRLKQMAEQESQGKSFWTSEFVSTTRMRIVLAFGDVTGTSLNACSSLARRLIMRDEGLAYLSSSRYGDAGDFGDFALKCEHDMMPTVIEAMCKSLVHDYVGSQAPYAFERQIKTILRESRISFDLIDGEIVPFSSMEMHVSVVAPVLQLLSEGKRFSGVESAYRDALGELADGKGADAITDAGTALQELLSLLGCDGNALGPLIKSARSKGVIAAHDVRLMDGIVGIMSWVSADRSESGDAHSASKVDISDAWLTVHVVGALILRLADPGPKRSG